MVEDLIKKLEEATEGSRELDEEIAKTVGALPPEAKFLFFNPETGNAEYSYMCTNPGEEPFEAGGEGLPYTNSLDAALTLVPEGAVWAVGIDYELPGFAHINYIIPIRAEQIRTTKNFNSEAATPALAVCIVALRAREKK